MKRTTVVLSLIMVLTAFTGMSGTAQGQLFPPGESIIVTEASDITVIFLGPNTSYVDEVWLESPYKTFLFWGHGVPPNIIGTPIGTQFKLGRFDAGTELIFRLFVVTTGESYYTGPPNRNADNVVHADVQEISYQHWRVGFEDLQGGGDRDYNDLIFDIIGPVNMVPPAKCIESVNPHGLRVPRAGSTTLPGPRGGQNEDGFYLLIGTEETAFYVDSFFGPYPSGTVLKITEAPGTAPPGKARSMGSGKGAAGAVTAHLILPNDPVITAVVGGTASTLTCLVPPAPK